MIAFDSYAKTSFEILIKSRIRSFLYQKMYKNADVFADIKEEDIDEFIKGTAWFEKQQKLKPSEKKKEKCGSSPCPAKQYCTRNNKCKPVPTGPAATTVLRQTRTDYYDGLREYLKAEGVMKGWYYSWTGGDARDTDAGNAINQWNGSHPKVKSGEWPWAQVESPWSPPGSKNGPVKIGIGADEDTCRANGGTTPRDPEARYNKLELWKNHMREYFYIVDGNIVTDDDEEDLANKFDKDFRNPITKRDSSKKEDVISEKTMAECNKLWHFLWTPMKYAGVSWKGSPPGGGSADDYEHHTSIRHIFYKEFDDIEGFGGVYKECDGSNSSYADVYDKCNSFFAAADSEYESRRNDFIPIKKEYNSLARTMGVDLGNEGFLGDLDFNGVLKLYNIAAYTIAVLAGAQLDSPKEKIAEDQLKKMFIDVFKENIGFMDGTGTEGKDSITTKLKAAPGPDITGGHPIEQKLAEYNILVDNAIYSIIEPIR